jgi:flagellar biosynthesis protein FlhG
MISSSLAETTQTSEAPEESTARPLTIAVTSGKGGVGKSQLVASLAVELSREQNKVLLVDADVGCGNLDVLLNVAPKHDLRAVMRGDVAPADVLARADFGDLSLPLLPAPMATKDGSELAAGEQLALIDAVDQVGTGFDVVLIDTGAGVSRNPMLFGAAADRIIVLTTPEPTAIRDAYAAIKVLHQAHGVGRVELVVNQAAGLRDGKLVYARLVSVVERFLPVEVGLLGVLPTDERVVRSVRARQPASFAYPGSSYAQAVRLLVPRVLAPVADRGAGGVRFFARSGG